MLKNFMIILIFPAIIQLNAEDKEINANFNDSTPPFDMNTIIWDTETADSDLIIEIVCSGNSANRYNIKPYISIFSSKIVLISTRTKTNKSKQKLRILCRRKI